MHLAWLVRFWPTSSTGFSPRLRKCALGNDLYAANDSRARAEAIIVENGVITFVGSSAEALKRKFRECQKNRSGRQDCEVEGAAWRGAFER